jgi:hypothetical protein
LFLMLLVALVACGSPEPQPLRFGEAVWRSGETSLYRITDVNGSYAGTAQYEMRLLDGDLWRMEREIQAQGIEELLGVEMAARGFRPHASTLVRIDDGSQERVSAAYELGEVNLELTTRQNVTTYERINVPSDSRDARALFMLVRSLPLASGYSTRINTFLPVAARMTRTEVRVLGNDQVDVPAGSYSTWVVELDEGDRQSRVWIGTEPPHPLVKYVDGANGGVFELAEFWPGE